MINDIRKALFDKFEIERNDTSTRISKIKKIIIGDPYQFAESELPALAIIGGGGSIRSQGTEYDRATREMTLVLVYPIKETLGALDHERVEWDYRISDITEGAAWDYQDSIVGVLRQNLSLSIVSPDSTRIKATLGSDIQIVYAPNQRGESTTHEARIDFSYSFTSCR